MKAILVVLFASILVGCANMKPANKALLIAGAVSVAVAVAAGSDDRAVNQPLAIGGPEPGPPCTPQPDGSCR